jgi:hypothetical protein
MTTLPSRLPSKAARSLDRQDQPVRLRWSEVVVRGRIELPTFRFSEGFAGPGRSITGRLTGRTAALGPFGIQDRPHVSTAVVSNALARSANGESSGRWVSGASCGLDLPSLARPQPGATDNRRSCILDRT